MTMFIPTNCSWVNECLDIAFSGVIRPASFCDTLDLSSSHVACGLSAGHVTECKNFDINMEV